MQTQVILWEENNKLSQNNIRLHKSHVLNMAAYKLYTEMKTQTNSILGITLIVNCCVNLLRDHISPLVKNIFGQN